MMRKKLRSRSGESLVEILCACLIVCIVVCMISDVMIGSQKALRKAEQVYEQNEKILEEYWSRSSDEGGSNAGSASFKNGVFTSKRISLSSYQISIEGGASDEIYRFDNFG